MKTTIILAMSFALCAPAHAQGVQLAATSANVGQPGSAVSIRILRWSTDEERGRVVAALNPPPAVPVPAAAAGETGGAARGARGRGGRGGARGRGDAPLTPDAALTAAIDRAPTVGYIWTNDVTGYSIKYAFHSSLPDGGERIVLATNRRLGAYKAEWKPVAATPLTDYEFTLLELRLNSKGLGEGKTSLTTKVIVDNEAKTIALENYAATPAVLKNVKR